MRNFILVCVVIIVGGIAYLSLTPTDTITIGNDKISHFIAYGTLMSTAGLLAFPSRKNVLWTIILCALYGILIEIGQHFVPGRDMSIYDVFANVTGVLLGTLVSFLTHKFLGNRLGLIK